MSDPWQECLEHCVEVATQAGKVIREGLKSDIAVMHKSSQVDLVTETDQRVERLIISSIKAKFPTHSFIGEESVAAGAPSVLTDDPTWIIDPIDGTTNFVHGFPFVCVSIGFTVKKQNSAWCTVASRTKCTQRAKARAPTATAFPSRSPGRKDPQRFDAMMANLRSVLTIPVHGIRSPGSAAVNMCLVASGAADAYYHAGIHCWDMAGGAAVVTEAGGVVTDVSGGPFDLMSRRLIAASSRAVAERLARHITEFHVGRDDADGS
ncbi:inositol monophosphatase 1-like isoform X4 [Phycodurus eques]|uniref:inositol monophosphatase 1-like isoform X4 n=1 Tax=Phycodurus eques TaxID=693459 RepID=UPI002ACE55A0|nr:inositol monophosphatase 1-like isoform X4 [Phycodurus eques]